MDIESLGISAEYAKLVQRSNENEGYYFTDEVLKEAARISELGEEDQKAFFSHAFKTVRASLSDLLQHPDCKRDRENSDEGSFDLSDLGLGTISIQYSDPGSIYTAEDFLNTDDKRSVGLLVMSNNFRPDYDKPDYTAAGYRDPIYAYMESDGTFSRFEDEDLGLQIKRLLDARETIAVLYDNIPATTPKSIRETVRGFLGGAASIFTSFD